MQKPEKPENLLPNGFGGEKENFSEAKIQTGYQKDVPDILGGANLNYLLDSLGKNLEYNNKISDFICNLPIGKYITTNANNELDYINTSISPATTDKLGGVKPDGTTITVTEDGTISGSVKVEVASSDKAGIIKPDDRTTYTDEDGTLHSPKWDLFDIIPKDHKLTFEESEGLELLGEYVYKDTQDRRYGYLDFYNKCLEEFQASNPIVSKKNNIKIIGSLAIEEGVIGGFSTSNYALLPKVFHHGGKNWELVLKIKTSIDVTTTSTPIGSNTNNWDPICFWIKDSRFVLFPSKGTANIGNVTGTYTVLPQTDYWIKIAFDGEKYTLDYSLDGDEYINDVTIESSTTANENETISLGVESVNSGGNIANPFLGSIDLKESYINIDGKRWWDGVEIEKNKLIYENPNGHKYYKIEKDTVKTVYNYPEKIGNLICEEGIITGFSSSSWGKINKPFSPSGNWKIQIRFSINQLGINQYILHSNVLHQAIGLNVTPDNHIRFIMYPNNTSSKTLELIGTTVLTTDTNYTVIISYDTNIGYEVKVMQDGLIGGLQTVETLSSEIKTPVTTGQSFIFGIKLSGTDVYDSSAFSGDIDISKSYIKDGDYYYWIGKEEVTTQGDVKEYIDEIYEKTGSAWYYGIDETNERILLPRKNFRYLVDRKEPTDDDPVWYNLYSDGWCEQGGTGQITTNIIIKLPISYRDILYTANANVSDESGAKETGAEMAVGFKTTDSFTIAVSDGYGGTQKTNWITSGYANEDFVPKNNIHLYMVVGNVPIKKAIGEYTEVTTSENDTLPLFTGINFNFTPNHVSWVKAGRISNANEYETAFNELVNCLNNNIYDLKIIEENQKDDNANYNEYWIVNKEERTFRPPLQLGKLPDTGLYFKVDNAVKDLEMLNAGKLFENCVRKHELIPAECVTDTYTNGTSGYRVWSDGYCEQWGLTSNLTANTWYDVRLLKEYKDTFYSIVNTCNIATDFSSVIGCYINWDTITPASFQLKSSNTPTAYWQTSGYLSEGEY